VKFVKIKNYVEQSFGGRPSFLLEMSDGKDYISNGCVFIEDTQRNRYRLISGYDCGSDLYHLLSAPGIEIQDLVNADHMFRGCTGLTEFNIDLPRLESANGMFCYCKSLTGFDSEMPRLKSAKYMFYGCASLTESDSDLPMLEDATGMLKACAGLTEFNSDLPADAG